MALSKDGVIFSFGQLNKHNHQHNLLTIIQYGKIDETMETRLLAIFMFNDCGSECVSSTVTIATENKKLGSRDGEVVSSW